MRRATISLIAIILLLVPYGAFAQNFEFIGSYDTPGITIGVFVDGNYAYLAESETWGGLQIFEVSDPADPTLVGSYVADAGVSDVFVSSNYAYLCVGSGLSAGEFRILDVADPANPIVLGSYGEQRPADCYVLNHYSYFTQGYAGLKVLNISDPINPVLMGECDTPGCAERVFIAGNYAYVADGDSGLQVINVVDPANPVLIGNYDTPGSAIDVFVLENYAYILAYLPSSPSPPTPDFSYLIIADITDPANPFFPGNYYEAQIISASLFVSGSYAYVTDGFSGLMIINVSDPSSPTFAGSYDTPGAAYDVYVSGDYIFVADMTSLQIVRFNPTVVEKNNDQIPQSFSLSQNYPNPFNAQTTISYSLPKTSDVTIDIFDLLGRKVGTISDGRQSAGEHEVIWDARGQSSGVYFYRITAGDLSETKKMVLMK